MAEETKDSLVGKILKIRSDLIQSLKKTGKNAHLKYEYFELSDFIPKVIELEKEHGVISLFSFDVEKNSAYITATDGNATLKTETPIVYAQMPPSKEGKKPNPIQELGATHTYLRRYLYLALYNIIEPDLVEAEANKPNKTNTSTKEKPVQTHELQVKNKKKEIFSMVQSIFGLTYDKALEKLEETKTTLGIDSSDSLENLQKLKDYLFPVVGRDTIEEDQEEATLDELFNDDSPAGGDYGRD